MADDKKITRVFKLLHIDDYRNGPELCVLKEYDGSQDEDEEEEEDDVDCYDDIEFEIPNEKKYHVYHLSLGIRDYDVKLLNSFDLEYDAQNYAKQQYTLFTGDYPFIADGGASSAYHPTGKRLKIKVPEEMKCDIVDDDANNYKYIIILHEKDFEAHSLNPFAVW